jgi:exo-beta-1,3-glucanase (GH17 family)
MHRFRIVVATALVSAMTLATYQVAAAGSGGTSGQSEFCATAQQLKGEIQSLDDIDLETVSIADVKSTYRTYVDLIKQLQKETPKALKNAFKRLRTFYNRVAEGELNIDVTSERSLRRFARDVDRAGKDVERIFTYLEDKCGITFSTDTTTATT